MSKKQDASAPMVTGDSASPVGPPENSIPFSYRTLFRWACYVVSIAPFAFALNTLLALLSPLLIMVRAQVTAGIPAVLARGSGTPAVQTGKVAAYVPQTLAGGITALVLLIVGIILLRFLGRLVDAWCDSRMVSRLQQMLHDKIISMGPGYHARHKPGETSAIVFNFVPGAEMMLREIIASPIVMSISLVTALLLVRENLKDLSPSPSPWMVVLLLAVMAVCPIIGWWLGVRLRPVYTKMRESQMAVSNDFLYSASSAVEVQLMGAQRQRSETFAARLGTLVKTRLNSAVQNEISNQFQDSLPAVIQISFLLYAYLTVGPAGLAAAARPIVAVYLLIPEAINPLQQIIAFMTGLNRAWPQVQSMIELLEVQPEIQDRPGAIDLGENDRSVKLENVTFGYPGTGFQVLRSLSHTFEAGKISAVVGRNGSGKSSILNLAVRLFDPEAGVVSIGDHDVRGVRLASLRQNVVKISQSPLFLPENIAVNLRLAKAGATEAEMESVLRTVGLWDLLIEKTKGAGIKPLDYVPGLSGGQFRLLAIARSLLCKPRILVLDEVLENLDTVYREQVEQLLVRICPGLTVLIVDQDMDFLTRFADQVCALEGGKFIESGTPKELYERQGLFFELHRDRKARVAPVRV